MAVACHAQAGDFTAQLITGSDRILADESANIKVVLSNGTTSAIRVMDNSGLARDRQLFFILLPQDIMDYNVLHNRTLSLPHTNAWGAISTNLWGKTRVLAPGQVHVWDFTELLPIHSFVEYLELDHFDIYAQVLVGTNQWAYSNTNTVRVSSQEVKDGILRFTGIYPRIMDGTPRHFNVYEHTTDGDRFLFCDESLSRICKVENGVVPSFEVEANSHILKVTFNDNSPQIRFDLWEGKVIP